MAQFKWPFLDQSYWPFTADDTKDVMRYDFPFILRHRQMGDGNFPECLVCLRCKANDLEYPDDDADLKDIFDRNPKLLRSSTQLRHLSAPTDTSHGSLKYIYPKEKFSEDIVLQF